MPEKDVVYAREFLPIALAFCKNAEFSRSSELIDGLIFRLSNDDVAALPFPFPNINASTLATTLGHIQEALAKEINAHRFVQVLPDKAAYLQPDLFGPEVTRVIGHAAADIKDAGSCIAVGLDTATVFHLMRAAEHGLRKLARVLRVKLTHSGRAQPIETADWNKVITGVKNKIANVRLTLPKGSKRDVQLEMYSDLADHCVFMKDIWRNPVSHTGRPYKPSEALGVFERVRDFMAAVARTLG